VHANGDQCVDLDADNQLLSL